MKHLFIPYELAVIAKEKGFDEECFAYYDKLEKLKDGSVEPPAIAYPLTNAPLYQQIADWFREKHNLSIEVNHYKAGWFSDIWLIPYTENKWTQEDFKTYYEALNKAITEALKLI